MSIKKRGKGWSLRFRPFGELDRVQIPVTAKLEAQQVKAELIKACRFGDFSGISPLAKQIAVRLYEKNERPLPHEVAILNEPAKDLTLWEAVELFLNYPTVKDAKNKQRHIYSLHHIVKHFGKDRLVKEVWAPDIRGYQEVRKAEKAAPSTINWEMSSLRRLFGVLIELRAVKDNPVPAVSQLSTKGSERKVYLSFAHVMKIVELSPEWFRNLVLTAYYTGMRKNEIMGLTRKNVDLVDRIIHLTPEDTKEGDWKRVPIHKDLLPVLRDAMKVASFDSDRIFLIRDKNGVHPPSEHSTKNPWRRACKKLDLIDPRPRFHDLRHTWRANARRSKVDWVIAERIMGHSVKKLSVNETYGEISDDEFREAIDSMTFDNGVTRVFGKRFDVEDGKEQKHGLEKM
jgi:integrase